MLTWKCKWGYSVGYPSVMSDIVFTDDGLYNIMESAIEHPRQYIGTWSKDASVVYGELYEHWGKGADAAYVGPLPSKPTSGEQRNFNMLLEIVPSINKTCPNLYNLVINGEIPNGSYIITYFIKSGVILCNAKTSGNVLKK